MNGSNTSTMEFSLSPSIKRWQTLETCTEDAGVDRIIYNNDSEENHTFRIKIRESINID
jgi:hypothetical protein